METLNAKKESFIEGVQERMELTEQLGSALRLSMVALRVVLVKENSLERIRSNVISALTRYRHVEPDFYENWDIDDLVYEALGAIPSWISIDVFDECENPAMFYHPTYGAVYGQLNGDVLTAAGKKYEACPTHFMPVPEMKVPTAPEDGHV